MNTEPVNPFQSPQAVDAPRRIVDHWRPTWRQAVLGLVFVAFLWAAVVTAEPYVQCYFNGSTLTNPTWLKLYADHVFKSAVLTFFFGVPLCSHAWTRYRLTPLGVLSAGGFVVFAIGVLIVVFAVVDYFDQLEVLRPKWNSPQNMNGVWMALDGLALLFTPFGLFALYLAYLRRRDEARGGEPRG
jgi:hypothetical protein